MPLVHTYHTVYEDYTHYFSPSVRWGRRAAAVFSRWITGQTDCVIAPTGKVRQLLLGYGVERPVLVIPSGIDLRRFRRPRDPMAEAVLRASLEIPAGRTVLLFVGRLAAEKNVEELLELRKALGDRPVTLLLVGDGPHRQALEARAAELGLAAPDVIFAGQVPPEQVADWYRLGTVFVSASTSETQGLTYAEALASGLPVLCRADPCLDGVIRRGENGWQYETAEAFLRQMETILEDSALVTSMGAATAASAEPFSAERFARRVEAVYLDQISRRTAERKGVPA